MVMEAEKFRDLQSTSWKIRKAGGVVQSESKVLGTEGLMV